MQEDYSKLVEEVQKKNDMLAKALEEAERVNMTKTAFLSNMSHEIRTPMNAIIGLYNIALRNPDLPDDTREILDKIGGSAKHLLSLINDILDMSRIDSGRVTIKQEDFSFGDMLEQVNTMIESQCQDRGLVFECRLKGQMDDYYVGDDMKLKQVTINILGNAVKFTEAPGRVLFLAEEVGREGDTVKVRFTMKDTGIGMDADYIPKIFEPFSQENEGQSNKYGSTGLGMAITKNIVDMMKGTIEVESEKGVGTTFMVTVPLGISSKSKEKDKPSAADTSSASSELDLATLKTIIIDDDETACEQGELVLKKVGISADYCMSGAEALEKMDRARKEGTPYQLMLVDWKMPGMDGIEVTRSLREKYNDDSTTVILTTYNWDEIMEEALKAGVDAFLAKPLFAKSIKKDLSDILKTRARMKKKPGEKVSLSGRRVLLAEDVEINALIMTQILNMKEIEADVAENGKEACELFEKHPAGYYDVILMDQRMPVMDGFEATKAIRSMTRPDAATIPIVALTANAFDEDVKQSLDAGMNAHLTKPVEPEALFKTIKEMIQSKGSL